MVGIEYRREHVSRLEPQSAELLIDSARDPRGSFLQAVAAGILADREKYFPDCALDPREIEAAVAQ